MEQLDFFPRHNNKTRLQDNTASVSFPNFATDAANMLSNSIQSDPIQSNRAGVENELQPA
eukprot:CAMPEP_0118701686 /NCGR_PEP_ID=MMETSP0800-20121206/17408_1 /TAXON_ID=210618 ORGANISM="Striatella unipunctata, Strain CCMP2910" /NCGR_SAMPLE_ID=MMETSP0800 /ASSEMBLY_ACC=CAM_ASM_000638 /LENGTH=59 /DNA_ID=CAMNT_0006602673 /DNA_START=427 /DNA_END=603 /DNA_ORIENTATION=-